MLPSIVLADPQGPSHHDVLTRAQAQMVLGLTPKTVSMLLASRFLPDLRASRVHALSRARRIIVTSGRLPVLRAGAAVPPPEDYDRREFLGDGAGLSDRQFLEASRRWWRCDADAVVSAGLLAVAVGGWVTGVLAVRGVERSWRHGSGQVRYAFDAEVAGRVGVLDDPATFRVLSADPALAALTGQLLGCRVQETALGGHITCLAG